MRKHPYIFAILFAILLSLVAWFLTPKEYTAITKVSDEYKETDLAIGLDRYSAQIRDAFGGANTGINDMEVYCKILETEDFARSIAHKRLANKNITYGEYLGEKDTIEAILDHINYNYSNSKRTLTISFTDRNAVIASQILDSVTTQLQTNITLSRYKMIDEAIRNIKKEQETAAKRYQKIEKEYSSFVDSHKSVTSKEVYEKENALQREVTLAYKYYEETIKQYTRQVALRQRSYMSFAVVRTNTTPLEPNTHLVGYIICFTIIFISFIKAWFLYKEKSKKEFNIDYGDLFSPWFITIGVWGSILLFLNISGNLLDPLSKQFYIDIFLWCSISCITSFTIYQLMTSNSKVKKRQMNINMKLFNILYVIAMIMTPLYIYQIYKLVTLFDITNLMLNLRELAIYGEGYGFLNYTYVINEVLLLIALWKYPQIPLWQLISIIAACLLYAIGNMEKITFFLIFTSSIFVLYEKGVIKIRTIAIGGLLLLILFYMFNLARSGDDSDYSKNESLIDFIGMYVLSAPVAYGRLHQTISDQFGADTLWVFYHYLGRFFSGANETHQSFQEFVFVPMATNVYTVMRPYFTDFGHIGVAFFAYLYGLITGISYRLMKNGQAFGTCLYTYLVYALLLQFFDEFITASLALIVQMIILLALITQQKFKFILLTNK